MNTPQNHSDQQPFDGKASPLPAVLVLDDAGGILMADPAAAAFWRARPGELPGLHLTELFLIEAGTQAVQWEALLELATGRSVPLTARLHDGNDAAAHLHLSRASGATTAYIAVVSSAPAVSPSSEPPGLPEAFSLLADHGPAGYFDLNFKTGSVYYSAAWKRLFGYAANELPDTYKSWLDLIHEEDSGAVPDQLGKHQQPGTQPFAVEFRMRHRSGCFVWVLSTGLQIVGSDGGLERVFGLTFDIDERKELEETAVANDERLQLLGGAGPLGVFELDFSQSRFWYSPAWKRLLGFPPDAAEGGPETFLATLPEAESGAGLESWFLQRSPERGVFLEPVTLRLQDGTSALFLLGGHCTPSRKQGVARVTGFLCSLPADRPETGGDPLASGLPGDVLSLVSEGVIVTDAAGKIVFINPVACRLLDLGATPAVGRPASEVFRLINAQSGQPSDDACARALATDQPLPLINSDALAPVTPGGAPQPVVWTARATFDSAGQPRGVIIVFRNPEEMKLTPEELVTANRFESLGLLASGIAHDFNNLLTTILGGISLAKDKRDPSALEDSEKACLAAKGLTRQLLTIAKGGDGLRTVVASEEILQDSVKIATAGAIAEVTVEVPAGTKTVLVDRAQMLQVFQNLICNAIEAMPPRPHMGRVQLSAANLTIGEGQIDALPAGDYVGFEVRDNGGGITPANLEKIFNPFFTTKKHGTGLGLATVLSLVRKHGGQIGVESTVGTGTVFTVFLPCADRPAEERARRAPTLRFGTGRVLFMDDDPKISSLTGSMLDSLEYKFDLARGGEETIALYKRYQNIGRPYDAVIMDLNIVGGMGGEETFKELLKLDPDVRAIAASGYDDDDMARRCLDMGFCGFLTKPYRITDLGKLLKSVLG